jgi:hypothetical protein
MMRTLWRRLSSAFAGGALLLVTLIEAYFQSFGFYEEHYIWPMQKYGVPTALRWQDIVFVVVFWLIAIALLYASYRLLKYAFRREHSAAA